MVDRHGRRGRSHARPRGREEADTRGAGSAEQRPRGIPAELARIAGAALEAALAAIPGAAFVVRAPGAVVHANARGAALLAADREPVSAALRTGAAHGPRGTRRFPVDAEHVLVILPDMPGDARTRVPAVARRWGLTPRQAAVLALVAEGATNRTVAEKLDCSEKTVELHVSALLAKAGCGGRAELVARFWTEHG